MREIAENDAVLNWVGKRNKAIGQFVGRTRLLSAVLIALCGGLTVAYLAYQVVHRITPTSDAKAAPIDITRVALTVVAGVGGVVALVIAYRRQRDLEHSRFVERFGAAAAQLGAADVAVRIAGVYAMAGVADESEGLRRQQCIDVLCGYLRLPYDTDHGASGRTKLVTKAPRVEHGRIRGETEEHVEYRQNDRVVRATIVRAIADHTRASAEYPWSRSDFDFRTAHLEDVDLSEGKFMGAVRFDDSVFSGDTRFAGATFDDTAWFRGATFHGYTDFRQAKFSGGAEFSGSTFDGTAEFERATFSDNALFDETTFSDNADFGGATFSRRTSYVRSSFAGSARFSETSFYDYAEFRATKFFGIADFNRVTFDSPTLFFAVTFNSAAEFGRTTFHADADFRKATFSSYTWFRMATFHGRADFVQSTFSGVAGFSGVTFLGDTEFVEVNFGAKTVSFEAPMLWGPPAPVFDWDQDVSRKPMNVEPQDWPPVSPPAA
ncbi:pentapeptide repeat-containing protein [Nocardia sp. NPDC055002]